jgi:hypothetical protein
MKFGAAGRIVAIDIPYRFEHGQHSKNHRYLSYKTRAAVSTKNHRTGAVVSPRARKAPTAYAQYRKVSLAHSDFTRIEKLLCPIDNDMIN